MSIGVNNRNSLSDIDPTKNAGNRFAIAFITISGESIIETKKTPKVA